MAHRLPPAGVATPPSEHYVNYKVIPPKPSHGSMSCEADSGHSSTRSKLLCQRQTPAQNSCKCPDLSQPWSHPGSLAVECAFRAPNNHHHKKCCLTKPCPRCVCCCARKEVDNCSPVCCCSLPKCCFNEENACAINITLPRSDDQAMEAKMKKKLKKLKTDVERFDEEMACLENKRPQVVQQCASECCPPRCCCCCAKPIPARDLSCAPRVCRKRPVCPNCRPFFGRKKSTFQKLKLI
ncbi:hypothetical protein BsWGS_06859 [Bradybaena similaris]